MWGDSKAQAQYFDEKDGWYNNKDKTKQRKENWQKHQSGEKFGESDGWLQNSRDNNSSSRGRGGFTGGAQEDGWHSHNKGQDFKFGENDGWLQNNKSNNSSSRGRGGFTAGNKGHNTQNFGEKDKWVHNNKGNNSSSRGRGGYTAGAQENTLSRPTEWGDAPKYNDGGNGSKGKGNGSDYRGGRGNKSNGGRGGFSVQERQNAKSGPPGVVYGNKGRDWSNNNNENPTHRKTGFSPKHNDNQNVKSYPNQSSRSIKVAGTDTVLKVPKKMQPERKDPAKVFGWGAAPERDEPKATRDEPKASGRDITATGWGSFSTPPQPEVEKVDKGTKGHPSHIPSGKGSKEPNKTPTGGEHSTPPTSGKPTSKGATKGTIETAGKGSGIITTTTSPSQKGSGFKGNKGDKGAATDVSDQQTQKGSPTKGFDAVKGGDKGSPSFAKGSPILEMKGLKGSKGPGEKGGKDRKGPFSIMESPESSQSLPELPGSVHKGSKGDLTQIPISSDLMMQKGKSGMKLGKFGKNGKEGKSTPRVNNSDEDVVNWVRVGSENIDFTFSKLEDELHYLRRALEGHDCHDMLLLLLVNCLFAPVDTNARDHCMRVIAEGRMFCQFLLSSIESHDEGEACIQVLSLAALSNPSALDPKQVMNKFMNLNESDFDFEGLKEFVQLKHSIQQTDAVRSPAAVSMTTTPPSTPPQVSLPIKRVFLKSYDNNKEDDEIISDEEVVNWVRKNSDNQDLTFTELANYQTYLSVATKVFIDENDYHDALLSLLINCLFSSPTTNNPQMRDRCMYVVAEGRIFCQFLLRAVDTHDEGEACIQILCLAAAANPSALNPKQLMDKFAALDADEFNLSQIVGFSQLQQIVDNPHEEANWDEKQLSVYLTMADSVHELNDNTTGAEVLLNTHKWILIESFMNPLRRGLDQVRLGLGLSQDCEVMFYSGVKALERCDESSRECLKMMISIDARDWSSRKNSLRMGNLVCMSDDKFCEDVLFGVVMSEHPLVEDEDEVLNIEFTVRVVDSDPDWQSTLGPVNYTYDLIESKVHYGSHLPLLEALEETIPGDLTLNYFSGDIENYVSGQSYPLPTLLNHSFDEYDDITVIEGPLDKEAFKAILTITSKVDEQVLLLFNSEAALDEWCLSLESRSGILKVGKAAYGPLLEICTENIADLISALEEARIVCSTTNCMLNNIIQDRMTAKVVILAEATEVSEVLLLSVLPPSISHLILFGDTSKRSDYPSTMERLINAGVRPHTHETSVPPIDEVGDRTRQCQHSSGRTKCELPCKQDLTCAHVCRGLCGEPCPDYCDTTFCEDGLQDRRVLHIRHSSEDDFTESTKYIQLGCKHIFDSKELDMYVTQLLSRGPGVLLRCPSCGELVLPEHTVRYRNEVTRRLALHRMNN